MIDSASLHSQPPVPSVVIDGLISPVLLAIAVIVVRIPTAPAAQLVRASDQARANPTVDTDVVDPLVVQRLLGSLELTIEESRVEPPDELRRWLGPPSSPPTTISTAVPIGAGEPAAALALIRQLRPDLPGLVADLAREIAVDPRAVGALAPNFLPQDGVRADEERMAAADGRPILALTVAIAVATLRAVELPIVGTKPPAVMALAVPAAMELIASTAPSPAYAAARSARLRAEFLLPRMSGGMTMPDDHRFGLLEFPAISLPEGEPANGLVTLAPNGIVVRTGDGETAVTVQVRVVTEAPEVALSGWDEVLEVSYLAGYGSASVVSAGEFASPGLAQVAPPWPGPVRVRVHAAGRDGDDRFPGGERYELIIWSAPMAAEVIFLQRDRLGHRLRGEPEPPPSGASPAVGYHWTRRGSLEMGATITVVTGLSADAVVRAFGADPQRPEPIAAQWEQTDIDPWVAVLPVCGAVVAVEFNGWQASMPPTMRRASVGGRAASAYWNVNALSILSFAANGQLLASFEPRAKSPKLPPEVAATLHGLDLADDRDLPWEIALVAVERFAGIGFTAADLARIELAGVVYRILPWLPDLSPVDRLTDGSRRWPGWGPLGADTDLLVRLPDARLRELAWWAAGAAALHAGLADEPAVTGTLATQALTTEAALQVRRSQLSGFSRHRQVWVALHAATNPDALGAAIGALEAAGHALGPDAPQMLAEARRRISEH